MIIKDVIIPRHHSMLLYADNQSQCWGNNLKILFFFSHSDLEQITTGII